MPYLPNIRTALAVLFCCFAHEAVAEDTDPASKWVSAYGWLQTGERLGEADQWPLAMGSFIESFRQIQVIAAQHPAFEPELIAYRLGKLEEMIAATEARLSTDEHEIMMKYLDFIESFELGQAQRFGNEFEASLATLSMAKSLLEEIIERKPAEFRVAVETQYRLVEGSIDWLNSQIDFKATSRPASSSYAGDTTNWGTTRFVKMSDLPSSEDGVITSGLLFPEGLVRNEVSVGDSTREEEEGQTTGAKVRFRMHSGAARAASEEGEGEAKSTAGAVAAGGF